MSKYIRIYFKLAKIRIMQFSEYRADMFTLIAASYGYNILALIFINVIFENFDNLAGWTKYQVILLYGVGQLLFYLYHGLLSAIENISDDIWSGNIDRVFLRPISPNFELVLSNFNLFYEAPSSLLALGIIIYSLVKLGLPVFTNLLVIFPLTLLGLILFSLTKVCIGYAAFWLTDTKDLNRFHWHMTDHSKFPIDMFPQILQLGLKTIIPTSLVSYFPVYIVLFGFDGSLLIFYAISFLIFVVLAKFLWKNGIRSYSSVST